ncbi:transcriptional regulator [Halobacteria archaeon AArc-dxtr1]|nr:transcriptional regulator [Halobacteria archaeon AArc-dxtr1]
MSDRITMGVDALDRSLGGGVPFGFIVAYTADPASQSERLLYRLTAEHKTHYLTTERSASAVRNALAIAPVETGAPTIRAVDARDPLASATRRVQALPAEAILVVDTADVLEWADREAYLAFLETLSDAVSERNALAILHCLATDEPPPNRSRTEHAADAILALRTQRTSEAVEHRLSVPKFRAGGHSTDVLTLELTDGVAVDESRDIV